MAKISINQDSLKPKREWKRHKVKEGSNIFRLLPPFGDESNGYPYRKWMVIWGLNDPESGRMRPYASSITSSEKACPVMEYVDALKKKVEVKKAQLQAAGTSEAEIKEALKPLNKVISNLRPKTVFAWNAVDKAGTLGLLEVKSTAQITARCVNVGNNLARLPIKNIDTLAVESLRCTSSAGSGRKKLIQSLRSLFKTSMYSPLLPTS